MYLRAGVFSLGLLLLSRVLGLLRESAQAAAFGSTGLGDAAIVMFTLPDLLVGVLVSGALSYVLLPLWARQSAGAQAAGQRKIAVAISVAGLGLGLLIWLFKDLLVQALAPGLTGDIKAASAWALGWSAIVLPLALLAAVWVTRLQHERDFVGVYAGSLVVNLALIIGLLVVANGARFGAVSASAAGAASPSHVLNWLGVCLMLGMLGRLAWLGWRLPAREQAAAAHTTAEFPAVNVWIWAALSSGLLLVFPLVARSLASSAGEGALASFNYAWKLIELPLVLAVQLVASVAFPAIARTAATTKERHHVVGLAFLIAWTLACAAVAVLATFSLPIAKVLFGWGRMSIASLEVIAQWSAIGIWSLLPQALMAVQLTVMATDGRMHAAAGVLGVGLVVLLLVGSLGGTSAARGSMVMWLLNAVFACMAAALMLLQRSSVKAGFPYLSCLVPLLVCMGLVSLKPLLLDLNVILALVFCAVFALLVTSSAVIASPVLRALLREKFSKQAATTAT